MKRRNFFAIVFAPLLRRFAPQRFDLGGYVPKDQIAIMHSGERMLYPSLMLTRMGRIDPPLVAPAQIPTTAEYNADGRFTVTVTGLTTLT